MKHVHLPRGSTGYVDEENWCVRCTNCFAVVGSIGQPKHCKEIAKKYEMLEALGGAKWDSKLGKLVFSN